MQALGERHSIGVELAVRLEPFALAALLARVAGNGVKVVLVETANRFARDLIVQLPEGDNTRQREGRSEKAEVDPGPICFGVPGQRENAVQHPKARDQPHNNPDEIPRRLVNRPDGLIHRTADACHQHYQDTNERRA
jgi:hypothetical protein